MTAKKDCVEFSAQSFLLCFNKFQKRLGGGGLGDIAIRFGYYRYDDEIMLITVIILVLVVQVMQEIGMRIANSSDRRKH